MSPSTPESSELHLRNSFPLVFETVGATFIGRDGRPMKHNAPNEDKEWLEAYMYQIYKANIVGYFGPLLLLTYEDGAPAEDLLPFSVAGCVAIWIPAENFSRYRP